MKGFLCQEKEAFNLFIFRSLLLFFCVQFIYGLCSWKILNKFSLIGVRMSRGRSIGLAIVGCGKIGRIRAEFARKNAAIEWIGLCDIDRKVGEKLTEDIQADFFTQDYKELLSRSEVDAVVISTFASERMGPVLASIEQGHSLFIEKPLATSPDESEKLVHAIEDANVDAVLGYSQRFRRRFMETKNRIASGQLGDVTSVVVRAFLNSFNPRVNSLKSEFPR